MFKCISPRLSLVALAFLEHPHHANIAFSSARALSMQGYALLNGFLAGRCVNSFKSPAAVSVARDQPASRRGYALLDANLQPVWSRAPWGALRRRLSQSLRQRWAVALATIRWGSLFAHSRKQFTWGECASSFLICCRSLLTRTTTNFVGEILMLGATWVSPFCCSTHKMPC